MPKTRVGFVYVMSNPAMPGIVKVGATTDRINIKTGQQLERLPEDRARQLHTTGVPTPFRVESRYVTSYPEAVESRAHELLADHRVSANREFFAVPPAQASKAVEAALLDAASIEAWSSPEPTEHFLDIDDRIVLTLRAGDLFVVMAHTSLISRTAETFDFWQAHGDGDVLELMGAQPGGVSGFSSQDPGGDEDPVPHLDRDGVVPNLQLNGKERLVPGTRLLWCRSNPGGQTGQIVGFQMRSYCQAVSRTSDPKVALGGHPLTLDVVTYDELPPVVVRWVRLAQHLPRPRCWAPLEPDGEEWAAIGDDPQPPEYWLTQLGRNRTRR